MKKCAECDGEVKGLQAKTPEGVVYSYYKCGSCGDEVVNMKQLHAVAEKYRLIRRREVDNVLVEKIRIGLEDVKHGRISEWKPKQVKVT